MAGSVGEHSTLGLRAIGSSPTMCYRDYLNIEDFFKKKSVYTNCGNFKALH